MRVEHIAKIEVVEPETTVLFLTDREAAVLNTIGLLDISIPSLFDEEAREVRSLLLAIHKCLK